MYLLKGFVTDAEAAGFLSTTLGSENCSQKYILILGKSIVKDHHRHE
eukprot:CAMPEP_0197482882 /NCGR_PEP_ID=MMETSP1309-20131121/56595_1 /TAXON_ID=464262 /ORGANISM="Genus nov. species nov., Strain RCC998" /LENGTH=46 /DNA_ID= /DNA_START= /DNA_END= /DNA_ORIENTATION=